MSSAKYASTKNKNLEVYFGFCDWVVERSKLCPMKVPVPNARAIVQLALKMLKEEYVSNEELYYASTKEKGGGLARMKQILNIKTRTIPSETLEDGN